MNYKKLAIIYFILISTLFSTEYQVEKTKQNLVKFVSEATFESFAGTTNNIDGYLFYKGDDFLNGSDVYFEVDLRTLDTGIGLRDRQMREDYLQTDKYPMTNYKGKIIYAEKVSDKEYKVTLDGTMYIHGISRPLKINGNLFTTDGGFRTKAYFQVLLSDYKIDIPKLMFMKLSNTIKLELDFYLKEIKK